MKSVIVENLAKVRDRIEAACGRVGRAVDDVTVVAVTKTHGADVVERVIEAGISDVGENRMQEFLEKRPQVTLPCRWHLVGTLQRNKAGRALGQFSLVHSVDRVRLAETLSRLGGEQGETTRILLEVNTSGEATKHGFHPGDIQAAASEIAGLPNLELLGLMTIGPLTDDETAVRRAFQTLFRLKEKLERDLGKPLPDLSMGMSDDFETAIEEGATIVRLGRVLFGARGA
jgi:pyridoxal phosphate enzyme (YggS family)